MHLASRAISTRYANINFPLFFSDFFDSHDRFRRKEGIARGLLSISTPQEFQMLTNSFSFSCTVQWQKARNRSVNKVSVTTKKTFVSVNKVSVIKELSCSRNKSIAI